MLVWPIKAVINCFVGFWSCASISIFGFVPGFLHIFRRCAGIFAFCFLEIWQCPDFSELCYRPCPAFSRRRERGERKSFIFRCKVGNRFLRLFIGLKKCWDFSWKTEKGVRRSPARKKIRHLGIDVTVFDFPSLLVCFSIDNGACARADIFIFSLACLSLYSSCLYLIKMPPPLLQGVWCHAFRIGRRGLIPRDSKCNRMLVNEQKYGYTLAILDLICLPAWKQVIRGLI